MGYAIEKARTEKAGVAESNDTGDRQMALSETWLRVRAVAMRRAATEPPLCSGCRSREARYGFRLDDDVDPLDRPRTLCFECFRMELARRQAAAAQLARGWNAEQEPLPLEDRLNALNRRRRRAQIAARHALAADGHAERGGRV